MLKLRLTIERGLSERKREGKGDKFAKDNCMERDS